VVNFGVVVAGARSKMNTSTHTAEVKIAFLVALFSSFRSLNS